MARPFTLRKEKRSILRKTDHPRNTLRGQGVDLSTSLSSSVSISAAQNNESDKTFTSSIASAGNFIKAASKKVLGSITSSSKEIINTSKNIIENTISSSTETVNNIGKNIVNSIVSSGDFITNSTMGITISNSISSVGNIVKNPIKNIINNIIPSNFINVTQYVLENAGSSAAADVIYIYENGIFDRTIDIPQVFGGQGIGINHEHLFVVNNVDDTIHFYDHGVDYSNISVNLSNSQPRGIDFNPDDGNLYVVDIEQNSFYIYGPNSDGDYVFRLAISILNLPFGLTYNPRGLSIANGNAYIVNRGTADSDNIVMAFDLDNYLPVITFELGSDIRPEGISVTFNRIYVVDNAPAGSDKRIVVFDLEGNRIESEDYNLHEDTTRAFGIATILENEEPNAIYTVNKIISNSVNSTIELIKNPIKIITSITNSVGELVSVANLSLGGIITHSNNIIKNISHSISNTVNNSGLSVKNITKDFISNSVSIAGGTAKSFSAILIGSIAISSSMFKNILTSISGIVRMNTFIVRQYILDNIVGNQERIDIYDNGVYQNSVNITGLTGVQGIAIDTTNERFAIVNNVNDDVRFYDYDINYLNETFNLDNNNNQPRGLAFSSDGEDIYVADQSFQNLYKYETNNQGDYILNEIVPVILPIGQGFTYNPRGLFITENNIFILNRASTDSARVIYVLNIDGNYQENISLDSNNDAGEGLSITEERIYVVNSGSTSEFEKVFVYGRDGTRFADEDYTLSNNPFRLDGIASRLIPIPNAFITPNKIASGIISSVSNRSKDISYTVANIITSIGTFIFNTSKLLTIIGSVVNSGNIINSSIVRLPTSVINSSSSIIKNIGNTTSSMINSIGSISTSRLMELLLTSSISSVGGIINNVILNIYGTVYMNNFMVIQYVLDNINGNQERVDIYNNGIYQSSTDITGLTDAQGIAIDTINERLAIVNNFGTNDSVRLYNYDLTYLNEEFSLVGEIHGAPRGLAFSNDGEDIYIVDDIFQSLYRYSPNSQGDYAFNGVLQLSLPFGQGLTYSPKGLFITDENIFILNQHNDARVIYIFDLEGTHEENISLDEGNSNGEGLSITTNRIYVVNSGSSDNDKKIFVYDRDGTRLANEDYVLSNNPFRLDGLASRVIEADISIFTTPNKLLSAAISSISSRSKDVIHTVSNIVSSIGGFITDASRTILLTSGILSGGKVIKSVMTELPMAMVNSSASAINNALINISGVIRNPFTVIQYILDNRSGEDDMVHIYENGVYQNSVEIDVLRGTQGIGIDTVNERLAIINNINDDVRFYDYNLNYLNDGFNLSFSANNQPRGIAFRTNGNSVLVAEQSFQNIYEYGLVDGVSNNIIITQIPSGTTYNPRGIFASEDNLFILNQSSDDDERVIFVFDSDGDYQESISLASDNNEGEGLSITEERIYVVNSGSSDASKKVFVYGRNGERFANEDYALTNSPTRLDGIASRLVPTQNSFMTANKVASGIISSVSNRSKDISHAITNTISSIGTFLTDAAKMIMVTGGVLINKNIIKNINNSISSIITSSTSLVAERIVDLLLSGSTLISGSIRKSIGKTFDATVSVPARLTDMTSGMITFMRSIPISGILSLHISRTISNNIIISGLAIKTIILQAISGLGFGGSIGVSGSVSKLEIGRILTSIISIPAQTSLSIAKNFAASINIVGEARTVLSKILSSITSPISSAQRSISKSITSTIGTISTFSTEEVVNTILSGTVVVFGSLDLSVRRTISGSVSISSEVIRRLGRLLIGNVNIIQSDFTKTISKVISSGVGALGSLTDVAMNNIGMVGNVLINSRLIVFISKNLTPSNINVSGDFNNILNKILSGTINVVGEIRRSIQKTISSIIGSISSFATDGMLNTILEGVINISSTILVSVNKTTSSSINIPSIVIKSFGKKFYGVVDISGVILNNIQKILSSSVGAVSSFMSDGMINRILGGTVNITGIISLSVRRTISNSINIVSSPVMNIRMIFSGSIGLAGNILKSTQKTLSSIIGSVGSTVDSNVLKSIINTGIILISGILNNTVNKGVSSTISPVGMSRLVFNRFIILISNILPSGGLINNQIIKSFVGGINSFGTISKNIFKNIIDNIILNSGSVMSGRFVRLLIDGSTAIVGNISNGILKQLSSTILSFGGLNTSQIFSIILSRTINITGLITKSIFSSLSGMINLLGIMNVVVTLSIVLSRSINITSSISKSISVGIFSTIPSTGGTVIIRNLTILLNGGIIISREIIRGISKRLRRTGVRLNRVIPSGSMILTIDKSLSSSIDSLGGIVRGQVKLVIGNINLFSEYSFNVAKIISNTIIIYGIMSTVRFLSIILTRAITISGGLVIRHLLPNIPAMITLHMEKVAKIKIDFISTGTL